jgi:hypothetical protein
MRDGSRGVDKARTCNDGQITGRHGCGIDHRAGRGAALTKALPRAKSAVAVTLVWLAGSSRC